MRLGRKCKKGGGKPDAACRQSGAKVLQCPRKRRPAMQVKPGLQHQPLPRAKGSVGADAGIDPLPGAGRAVADAAIADGEDKFLRPDRARKARAERAQKNQSPELFHKIARLSQNSISVFPAAMQAIGRRAEKRRMIFTFYSQNN